MFSLRCVLVASLGVTPSAGGRFVKRQRQKVQDEVTSEAVQVQESGKAKALLKALLKEVFSSESASIAAARSPCTAADLTALLQPIVAKFDKCSADSGGRDVYGAWGPVPCICLHFPELEAVYSGLVPFCPEDAEALEGAAQMYQETRAELGCEEDSLTTAEPVVQAEPVIAVNKEAPQAEPVVQAEPVIAVNKEAPQAAAATYSLQEEGKYCDNQVHAFPPTVHDLGACAEIVQQNNECGAWMIYYPTGGCYCVPVYADHCDFATSVEGAKVYMFEAA